MKTYRAAVIGCSRMGAFIDNEVLDDPTVVRPYSHAACYEACDRTDLVACSDLRVDVMDQFGQRYSVPKERQYTDYREMIDRERPEIVSVATQPEERTDIILYALERGARAIYAEKALCASMQEADALVEAVERNGAVLNMGTQKRWQPGFDAMKDVIDGGELGPLKTLIVYNNPSLWDGSSHEFDILMRLNSDSPAAWVQAHLPGGLRGGYVPGTHFEAFDGDDVLGDPSSHGIIQFENGVVAYALLAGGRGGDYEATCEGGVVTCLGRGLDWQVRRPGLPDGSGQPTLVREQFPDFPRASANLRIVEDLVHSLDTGEPPRGGVRLARAITELIFAFIVSHMRGGARVELPLKDCTLRHRRLRAPKRPRYAAPPR